MFDSDNDLKIPSCVLLDLDNTLYEYDPCHQAADQAIIKQIVAEIGIDAAAIRNCLRQGRLQIKDQTGDTASSHNRLLYIQRAFELAGLGSQPRMVLALEKLYWRKFLETSQLFPDAENLLDDLRIQGVPVVIVTDLIAETQLRKFVYWGLDKHIDHIVTSEEAGKDKPDPAIFTLALAKLGGVEGQVWMVGDSLEKDIRGAKNAVNAKTFLRASSGSSDSTDEADMVFQNFGELRRLLVRLS